MTPKSVQEVEGGLRYFPRMLDKIRLFAKGELDGDYHFNLGRGMDRRLTDYLRVKYNDLRARVLEGGTDAEVLEWCFEKGRRLDKGDVEIWNGFASKLGWNDFASDHLAESKAKAGLADRDDIQTIGQLIDAEEGRSA